LNYLTNDGGKTWQSAAAPSGSLNAWRADDPTRNMVAGVPVTFSPVDVKNPGPGAMTYRWLFGDGESASGGQVNHTYRDPGSYIVTLVMDNGSPLLGAATAGIGVANTAPDGALWVADGVDEGSPFVVQFLTSHDALDIHATEFTYQFDCGDGAGFHAQQKTPSLTCPTDDNQTRTVQGRIIDARGQQSTSSRTIPVRSVAPTALVNLGPDAMDVGGRVTLSASNVQDPSKPDSIAGFQFDFDCYRGGHKPSSATSIECPVFSFPDPRQVSVTITDKNGASRTYSHTIIVNAKGPVSASIDNLVDDTGVALQPGNPAQFRQWLTLTASVASSDPGDSVAARLSWGDGGKDVQVSTATAQSTLTHWCDQPGEYTVTSS
jgi:PKD repeat protein